MKKVLMTCMVVVAAITHVHAQHRAHSNTWPATPVQQCPPQYYRQPVQQGRQTVIIQQQYPQVVATNCYGGGVQQYPPPMYNNAAYGYQSPAYNTSYGYQQTYPYQQPPYYNQQYSNAGYYAPQTLGQAIVRVIGEVVLNVAAANQNSGQYQQGF